MVVGAGPAGLISAIGAAGLGAKVALIERHRMGGDCLNVAVWALLAYSKRSDADFQQAFSWLRGACRYRTTRFVERYTEAGVDVFLGEAAFNDAGDICVDGLPLNARRIACVPGPAPYRPFPDYNKRSR